ncbi:MAG: Ada metal-binding domain-containing protein [Methanobrevibacter sp.]|uniref:Ada metal-binding domain-containing protein n=1 Tax=Methanobrevibacter sp. TaxID=66852 RepID=UPI002E75A971|nr:Ada metal-binding domain-containing protein [Methanobrevibacter sp.]MEE0943349.1 Ada metal-binding domain-containing protein [Methanobrevibacter sp.]
MWNKKFNFITILLIVIGVCISFTVVTSADTTNFNSDFMEGTFVGHVDLKNASESYMQSYEDSQNKITYNISTVDDSVSLMDIYYLQGVMNPTKLTINGNDWNIYISEAIENETGNILTIVICQCQKEKQGYLVYVIFDPDSYTGSLDTNSESFVKFIKPLLESLKLKETSKIPKISEEFGMSDEEFQQQMEMVRAYKNGDTSALDDTASSSSSSSGDTYWASSSSGKFHKPSCEWAQKISSKNKVVFHSRDEAISSGYQPCSVCSP